MADRSRIEWVDATWNPTTGCDRVSPGCDRCYAAGMARRLSAMGQPRYARDGPARTSGPGFGVSCHRDVLDVPARWRAPRRVLVDSMGDLFHREVPDGFVREVFDAMASVPRHTFCVLTKRSARMAKLSRQLTWPDNVWAGVSVEDARYLFRATDLAEVRAPVRFVSAEPLLGPLEGLDVAALGWVITGGETGPGARPCSPGWVRDLRDRCERAGVPFFFKGLGGRPGVGRALDGCTHDDAPAG